MARSFSYARRILRYLLAVDLCLLLCWASISIGWQSNAWLHVMSAGVLGWLCLLGLGGVNARLFSPRPRLVAMSALAAMLAVVLLSVADALHILPLTPSGLTTVVVLAGAGLVTRVLASYALQRPGLHLVPVQFADNVHPLLKELSAHPHVTMESSTLCRGNAVSPRRGPLQATLALCDLHCTSSGFRTLLDLTQRMEVADIAQVFEDLTGKTAMIRDLDILSLALPLTLPTSRYARLKPLFDKLIVLLTAPITVPIMLLAALAVKLSSPGPVLFVQRRLGQFGTIIRIYKFRTMVADAEEDGRKWSSHNDNRVTGIGRVLRFTAIDELPQLWNVLRGEMSLIGPRPECPEIVKRIEERIDSYHARLLVLPGLAGWAQLHQGGDATMQDVYNKLRYDLYYIKRQSLLMDLQIAIDTVQMLLLLAKPKACETGRIAVEPTSKFRLLRQRIKRTRAQTEQPAMREKTPAAL